MKGGWRTIGKPRGAPAYAGSFDFAGDVLSPRSRDALRGATLEQCEPLVESLGGPCPDLPPLPPRADGLEVTEQRVAIESDQVREIGLGDHRDIRGIENGW